MPWDWTDPKNPVWNELRTVRNRMLHPDLANPRWVECDHCHEVKLCVGPTPTGPWRLWDEHWCSQTTRYEIELPIRWAYSHSAKGEVPLSVWKAGCDTRYCPDCDAVHTTEPRACKIRASEQSHGNTLPTRPGGTSTSTAVVAASDRALFDDRRRGRGRRMVAVKRTITEQVDRRCREHRRFNRSRGDGRRRNNRGRRR